MESLAIVQTTFHQLKSWFKTRLSEQQTQRTRLAKRLIFEEIEEQAAWLASLQLLQLNKDGLAPVLAGIRRRHGPVKHPQHERQGLAIKGHTPPLFLLLELHQRRFEPGSPGLDCISAAIWAALESTKRGNNQQGVVQAVRAEIQAQIADACT